MRTSTFNSQFSTYSPFSPSEDWLTNRFGANYLLVYDDWKDLPYSSAESGLKIPVGNGITILPFVIGIYAIIVFIRKKLRIEGFAS